MPRNFNSTADFITNSVGACSLTGAFTWVALVRRTSDSGFQWVASVNVTTDFKFGICLDTTSICSVVNGESDQTGLTYAAADGYALIGSGKAAGTATPRFHLYVFGTNTFSHADGGGTQGNPTSGGDAVRFALNPGGGEAFAGDIAGVALYDRKLTDVEFENLAFSLQAWYAAGPVGGWLLDQAATTTNVIDFTGNGANQSTLGGTTVATVSVPVFSYGYEVAAHSSPAVAAAGVPYSAQRTVTVRDYGEVPWIQRDRRNVHLVATAANDLAVPLLVAEHSRQTYALSALLNRRMVPQQPDRHLRALDATAANDLAVPLLSPPDRFVSPVRSQPQRRGYASDPSLLTPAADVPAPNAFDFAAYARAYTSPRRPYVSDPSLLGTALLENELLVGEQRDRQQQTATHTRGAWSRQPQTETAAAEEAPPANTQRPLILTPAWTRQFRATTPGLLDTALLEDPLLSGSTDRVVRVDRFTPQQRRYASDPGLLAPAEIPSPPRAQAFIDRRVQPYQIRWNDLGLLAVAADPLLVAGGGIWRRYLIPATHVSRRATRPQPIWWALPTGVAAVGVGVLITYTTVGALSTDTAADAQPTHTDTRIVVGNTTYGSLVTNTDIRTEVT